MPQMNERRPVAAPRRTERQRHVASISIRKVAVFRTSDASGFVNGAELVVDGGLAQV